MKLSTLSINHIEMERRERRRSTRKELSFPVQVSCSKKLIYSCTAANVSFSGMFLNSHGHKPPHHGDTVKIAFILDYDGQFKRCQLIADVVGVSDEGFSVEFHHFDASSFRYIHKIMHEADVFPNGEESAYFRENYSGTL